MCRDKEVKSMGEDKEVVKKKRKTDIKKTVMARRVDKEMKQRKGGERSEDRELL